MTREVLPAYLAEIERIHATRAGTGEISYYGALARAFDAIGMGLRPRVFCVPNLANRGAGFPDMGLFEGGASAPESWPEGRPPERGVVEADGIDARLEVKLGSKQVADYLARYGLVLVTNFREFVLLGQDVRSGHEVRERFDFGCASAESFFALTRSTRRQKGLGTRFAEFLERVLLHKAPLGRPEEVAFFLASYARDALARVEAQASLPAFASLREALQEALGMRFEGLRGEHLFRSTLVQTLFYGLFSAWVDVARAGRQFQWQAASWSLHVPFVDTLFQRIAIPQHLQPLGLEESLAWAASALERVVREVFFARFEEADAVRYFYEPFLAAFDPELRKTLGVWYTPREIVRYMVERVDRVLREELDLADGLADSSVWILDPCCGTGAYLVEVLRCIGRTLQAKGEGALAAAELKRAAMTRVAGFEIMPAPYVIAHWQVGQALRAVGADPFRGEERAAIYLTNALTGWAAPAEAAVPDEVQHGLRVTYPPLADERDKAARVKRERPILVVLGNPPYNAFAGTSPAEESGLVAPYKEGLRTRWGIRKFNLNDLYVRFFRVAERRIAEQTGCGVVCFISNHSWLSLSSYVVMRQRLVAEFDRIWIDNLNGSKFETGKVAPDGSPDPSAFSTEANREGIQVGTAIALLAKQSNSTAAKRARYRDLWGPAKREALVASLGTASFDEQYVSLAPTAANRFSLRPGAVARAYATWPKLPDLAVAPPFNGLMEKRGGALIEDDRGRLEQRMRAYFDGSRDWESVRAEIGGLARKAASFDPQKVRAAALRSGAFEPGAIVRYYLRPFDSQWAYATPVGPVWNRARPELLRTLPVAGGFLVSRPAGVARPEGVPFAWTPLLGDNDALRGHAYYIPVSFRANGAARVNLSPATRAWIAALGLPDPDTEPAIALLPWHHALAIGYAPNWLAENADGIRQDWPRVPLPGSADLLCASAALGARIAALLDPDTPVPGVTAGSIPAGLAAVAVPSRQGGGPLTEPDYVLTAGWGHAGKSGAVMPGRGRLVTRAYALDEAATGAYAVLLGARTQDVYLNGIAYWRNVPEEVWNFTIGGYQVVKKYLAYRERSLLGRVLTPAELRHVRDAARRLAALRLMGPELDANYRASAASHRPLGSAG